MHTKAIRIYWHVHVCVTHFYTQNERAETLGTYQDHQKDGHGYNK